jgi:hypothetical protein
VGRQSARSRVTSHPTRHVGSPYPGCTRTPRRRSDRRSEARAANTVRLSLCRMCGGLGRCHAATADSPPRTQPSAIGRRPHHTSPPPRAHCVAPVGHDATEQLPRHAPSPINPPLLFPCMPEPAAAARH